MSLKNILQAYNDQAIEQIPKETMAVMLESGQRLAESRTGEQALKVGDKIPSFTLGNANGDLVDVYKYLEKGPLVINFYRGAWCPYCNLELKAYRDLLPQINALGANLIAVSPELPDNSLSLIEKHGLEFEVLSDLNNEVADKFGLVFKLDQEVLDIYNSFGFAIEEAHGNDDALLPLPATYVVDTRGEILLAYINTDYTKRLEPKDALTVLKNIVS